MNKDNDALKFFHAYIDEMIDIGGPNLPKAVSTKLGSKLGKIYKNREINQVNNGIRKSFNVLGAKVKISEIDDDTYKVLAKYKHSFCPIGGKYKANKAEVTQKSLCIPYYLGFLNELDSERKHELESLNCIMKGNTKYCEFLIKRLNKHEA